MCFDVGESNDFVWCSKITPDCTPLSLCRDRWVHRSSAELVSLCLLPSLSHVTAWQHRRGGGAKCIMVDVKGAAFEWNRASWRPLNIEKNSRPWDWCRPASIDPVLLFLQDSYDWSAFSQKRNFSPFLSTSSPPNSLFLLLAENAMVSVAALTPPPNTPVFFFFICLKFCGNYCSVLLPPILPLLLQVVSLIHPAALFLAEALFPSAAVLDIARALLLHHFSTLTCARARRRCIFNALHWPYIKHRLT